MRVLIVGGGIAGTAMAACLKRRGFRDITLIEKAAEFHTIGFLIGLMGNGQRVLRELGIESLGAGQKGYQFPEQYVRDMRGNLLTVLPVPHMENIRTVAVHRSDMHDELVRLLSDTRVRFGTTIANLEQIPNGVRVRFSDGAEEMYDLVIGADGIHSKIRTEIFGANFVEEYNWRTWLYWVPKSTWHDKNGLAFVENGKVCAVTPYYDRSMAWIVAKIPFGAPMRANHREQLTELFTGFSDEAQRIIGAASNDAYCTDLVRVEMPHWYTGRIMLAGDAQHGVSPFIGMGASMALEDAHVFAEELERCAGDIDSALARYAIRRERRLKKFRHALERIEGWMMLDGFLGALRNRAVPFIPPSYFVGPVQRLIEGVV